MFNSLLKKSAYGCFALISCIALGASAFADMGDDCADIRLDKNGGPMQKVIELLPNISQTMGTCSFQTAAQMYDAWRFKFQDSRNQIMSSPVILAFDVKKDTLEKSFDGGTIRGNLENLLKTGSCARNYFESSVGTDTDEVMYRKMYQIFNKQIAANTSQWIGYVSLSAKQVDAVITKVYGLLGMRRFYDFNPYLNKEKIAKAFDDRNFIQFVKEVIPPACSNNERMNTAMPYAIDFARYTTTNATQNQSVINSVNAEFNQGLSSAMPIGISYCSSVLQTGKRFKAVVPSSSECGRHASIIMGRRKNPETNQCQFLVRNTWNVRHTDYSPSWQSEGARGSVWVNADVLARSIFELTKIKKKTVQN